MPWTQQNDFTEIYDSGADLNRSQGHIPGEDNQIIRKVSICGYRDGSIRLVVYARNSQVFNELNAGMGNPVFKPNGMLLNELSILTLDKRLMGFFLKKLSDFQPDFPVQAVCLVLGVNLNSAYTEQEVANLPAEQEHTIAPQSPRRLILGHYSHNRSNLHLSRNMAHAGGADEAFNLALRRSFNETNHRSEPLLIVPEREDPDPEDKLKECEGFKQEWICPIDLMIMTDPVYFPSLANKQCFERSSIVAYIGKYNTHPLTREPITVEMMVSNSDVKTAIDTFIEINRPKPRPNK